jgi:uncharacterized protein
MDNIHEGFNRWTWVALGLVGTDPADVAAVGFQPHAGGLDILFTGKFFGVLIAMAALTWLLRKRLSEDERATGCGSRGAS